MFSTFRIQEAYLEGSLTLIGELHKSFTRPCPKYLAESLPKSAYGLTETSSARLHRALRRLLKDFKLDKGSRETTSSQDPIGAAPRCH